MQKFIWNAHVICEITISNSNLHIMIIEENQIFVSVSIFFFFCNSVQQIFNLHKYFQSNNRHRFYVHKF